MAPRSSGRTILACGLAAAVCALAGSVSRAEKGSDEAAILAVMARGADAFNRHDAAAAAAVYADDADLVNVRGDHLRGVPAIEQALARAFATRYKGATMKRGDVSIRFLRPDVALAYVTNEITVGGDGGTTVHRELGLRVFVRDGGEWRIAALHNTPLSGG